jgi:hypothetical protein
MNKARRIILAVYALTVALALVWVPWTEGTGYWWLWSSPRPRAIIGNDIVSEARQRWKAEHEANDKFIVEEKWAKAVLTAPEGEKDKVRREAKIALDMANLKQVELSNRADMSDQEVLGWLRQQDNFNSTFPEKAKLDGAGRQKLLDEWKATVAPAKEWNERIQDAGVDYRRIGMELLALTALCAVGFVLTPQSPPTRL